MVEYCLGFAFDPTASLVMLIEKQKPEWQKGLYNGIGGKIELGEIPVQAMVREFKEETTILTKVSDWIYRFTMLGQGKWKVHIFVSILPSGLLPWSPPNEEQVYYVKVDGLHATKVIPNLKWIIPLCLQKEVNIKPDGIYYD